MTTRLVQFARVLAIAQLFVPASWGQEAATQSGELPKPTLPATAEKNKNVPAAAVAGLHTELTKISSEIAQGFLDPLRCDSDGNLYLRTAPSGVGAIHKLNSKGVRVALFQPKSADVKVNFPLSFDIAPNGDVYQLISAFETTRYVFVYDKDGGLKSEIKLQQPRFAFFPSKIAVFPNGDLLVSGLEHDKDRDNQTLRPFTGIFSSDGTLRRELTLKDDKTIYDMATSGNPKVTPPENPSANYAVSQGVAETGADGNVYLMRRLSPAIIYAISPGGSVHRFEVDPGQRDFLPDSMHVVGNRIAVLFWEPQTNEEILKVVDLQGHDIAVYDEPAEKDGGHTLGLAFVCYAQNPERFIFLETMDDEKLGLMTATPK